MILEASTRRRTAVDDVESAFEALSHRVRRDIVQLLAESGELPSGEIADRIDSVGRTTVSTHLKVLRMSGIVLERREGRNHYYRVDQEGIAREVLAFMQGILHAGLTDIAPGTDAARQSQRAG
jgi:ArsR family transcriptional regulator, arsenate/arsenite/antimonite-responsive transcriptional repressor